MEEVVRFMLTRTELKRVLEYLYDAAAVFDGRANQAAVHEDIDGYLRNKTESSEIYSIINKFETAAKKG